MLRVLLYTLALSTYIWDISAYQGGPIDPCEENDQYVADRYSCTRYHRCRQLEGTDEFTTDIAICSGSRVFDMVLSECVDSQSGFLQDPAGCSTFYGCHPTKETSEGLLRRHYTCPGDLRFNPEEKYCTFKTNVTDDLCNSRDPDQRIIGDVIRNNEISSGFTNRQNVIRPTQLKPTKTVVVNNVLQKSPSSSMKNNKQKDSAPSPVVESNLDRIAQVISGQLLNLHGRGTSEEVAKPDQKDMKKEEKKVAPVIVIPKVAERKD